MHELPGGQSEGGQWRKLWDGGPAQYAWILLGGLAVQLDLEGSGAGEVHSREHALEWPYTRIDQPKPRPGPASPALGLPTPPSGCGSGLGSAVRGWTLRGGCNAALSLAGGMDPSRAIQHEISSLKGAGRGWGPSRRARTRL